MTFVMRIPVSILRIAAPIMAVLCIRDDYDYISHAHCHGGRAAWFIVFGSEELALRSARASEGSARAVGLKAVAYNPRKRPEC